MNSASTAWAAKVLTIFPEMFPGPLDHSLVGQALEADRWSLEAVNIRDFATDRHKSVDDTPFGGGAGMVMRPNVIAAALDDVAARVPRSSKALSHAEGAFSHAGPHGTSCERPWSCGLMRKV